LAKDKDGFVRQQVSSNVNTRKSTLAILTNDKNMDVVVSAAIALKKRNKSRR
jgi:hypothetical protein